MEFFMFLGLYIFATIALLVGGYLWGFNIFWRRNNVADAYLFMGPMVVYSFAIILSSIWLGERLFT